MTQKKHYSTRRFLKNKEYCNLHEITRMFLLQRLNIPPADGEFAVSTVGFRSAQCRIQSIFMIRIFYKCKMAYFLAYSTISASRWGSNRLPIPSRSLSWTFFIAKNAINSQAHPESAGAKSGLRSKTYRPDRVLRRWPGSSAATVFRNGSSAAGR